MNEKMLQEMDWRARVFDSLSFPTLIMKPDKSILTANQVFLERRSLDVEQIVGKKCHEIFYGEKVCPNEVCPLKKVISEKKGQSIIRRTHSLTGKQIWEDRVFSPILDEDGNVDYIMESVRDVTRLKNLEITLKEAEAFLEKIIYASPIAIVVADGYANILLMNPAAEDLFGYSQREAITRIAVENLYPAGTAKGIMKQLRSGKKGGRGKLLSTHTIILNADGQEVPVELNASIIYEDDSEVATVGIYKDLRPIIAIEEKLKKANSQIVQSEKMASLGKLAAGVAHEINNPLTGILLYANIVLEGLDANDTYRKKLQNVVEDANRCSEIVKNLLAYSRQTNPTKTTLAMNALVDDSLALIRDQKLFMHVKLQRSFAPQEMCIQVDKNQMAQVIINLVMNGVDAMDKKGVLTLRTYRNEKNHKICLEIADTGCGISKENLLKIFDPFFTTKALGQGTGLGLSTVYGIIKENHGDISVKKTSSQGTTFLIQFPEHRTASGGAFL
jgi:two-component system NtrC family sensor kinase